MPAAFIDLYGGLLDQTTVKVIVYVIEKKKNVYM